MATTSLMGNNRGWVQFCQDVAEAFLGVEPAEMVRYEGHREQLVGHIARKTGLPRSDIQHALSELAKKAEIAL